MKLFHSFVAFLFSSKQCESVSCDVALAFEASLTVLPKGFECGLLAYPRGESLRE